MSYHDHKFHPIHVSGLCCIFSVVHLWVIPGLIPWSCRPVLGQNNWNCNEVLTSTWETMALLLHLPALPIYLLVTPNLCHSPHTIHPFSPLHYHAIRWLYLLSIKCKLFPSTYPFNVVLYTFYYHHLFSLRCAGYSL